MLPCGTPAVGLWIEEFAEPCWTEKERFERKDFRMR